MPHALADQCLGFRSVEIRTLPALLSPGTHHLERAILSPRPLDHLATASARNALSLRRMPLQFREFQTLQREVFVEKAERVGCVWRRSRGNTYDGAD
jgi:hypothetical protein